MTKVVFQDASYVLRDEFLQETRDSGFEAFVVEIKNGVQVRRSLAHQELAQRFNGRVASLVKSEDKTVSVFREALNPAQRDKLNELYSESIQVGLDLIAREFTARTGAQGKVRLPAEATFVVIIHTQAKDGSPQLHAHVLVGERVRVQGQDKDYATHTRELYSLRQLFSSAASQHFGNRLQAEFGVNVQKTNTGIKLPDVPQELCQRSSVRTQQINDYIKSHNLKDTPLTRKYAAVVTRRENKDPTLGQKAFQAELKRSGFQAEQICQRVTPDQFVDMNRPSFHQEVRRIGRETKRLAKETPTVTHNEVLARALETASPHHSVKRIQRATEKVLQTAKAYGLHRDVNEFGKTVYTSQQIYKQWQKISRKVEYLFKADAKTKDRLNSNSERFEKTKGKSEGATTFKQSSQSQEKSETKSRQTREQSTDIHRVVDKVLRSYQVIGAVGHVGVKAAEKAIELYQTWAKPVWRVHGNGHKNMPGSVAKMVRDLKPLTMMEAHKAAITAMLKLNGTLEQKLRYGEYVYRQSRKPKFRVPKNSLIVIRDVGLANPKDVSFLLRKAERAKAKTIFVEKEHARQQLLQAAKSMKPGEARHYNSHEMSR